MNGPSVRLIESALLGNGGLGVMIRVRPGAIVLHVAPNAVWDRRIDESHAHDMSTFEVACRSQKRQLVEGGNDIVFRHLQALRAVQLDREELIRHLEYCELPNGTITDMVFQSGGRYSDITEFDFRESKGFWVENFATPVLVTEMLIQSHAGRIVVFAAMDGNAAFASLRAKGAFLVASLRTPEEVVWIEVFSEAGAMLQLELPWHQGAVMIHGDVLTEMGSGTCSLQTVAGESCRFTPLGSGACRSER